MRFALPALAVLIAAGAAQAQAPAPASAEKSVPVSKVFRYYDVFLGVPEAQRSKIRVDYILLRDGKPAPDLHPALIDDGQRIPLPLSPTGKFLRLPTLDQLKRKLTMTVDAPADAKLSLTLDLQSSVEPAQEMSAADVATSIAQVNGTVGAAVGALSILAPRFTKAAFPKAGSGVAISADGRATPLPLNKAGAPVYEPAVQKGAVKLKFARAPSKVDLQPSDAK